MKRIGVTGGIGSGKSAFCKVWEEAGAYVIYADDFAKELMVSDEELIQELKNAFGEEAYFGDGSLNRKLIAEEAFEKNRVQELNSIVHPILRKRIRQLADKKESEGEELFVYEAAILLNEGRPEGLDYVILLRAEKNKRIARASQRDKADPEHILERMNKQPDFDQLEDLCDIIVDNNGDLSELKKRSLEVLEKVKELSN